MVLNVLIIDDVHPLLMQNLEKQGIGYAYRPEIQRTEIMSIISGYSGIVVRSKTQIDAELMAAAPSLVFIARAGSGMDNVDVACAEEKGIHLINVPEANSDAVGEHTIGMLLTLMNNLNRADRQVRNHIWQREANRGIELKGKTVGIIGYGFTGSAVARKLRGFECRILAYDKYKQGFGNSDVQEVDLQTIFHEAEILSLHVPLTTETQEMVNEQFLSAFRKKIVLLNLSRGKVVNLSAVTQAMRSGTVLACALDVLENEKLNTLTPEQQQWFDYLIHSEQTVLTPHIGGWTHESYEKISFFLSNKISYLANRLTKNKLKV